MDKVIVIGCSGTGKSTLALQLEQILKIPVFHLDQLFWSKNWQSISQAEFIKKQEDVLKNEPQWIIDGNYADSLELRLAYADTIIFLDLPRFVYFPRIFKRYLQNYGKVRVDMADGCQEQLDFEFIQFVWTFKRQHYDKLVKKIAKRTPQQQFVHLTTRKSVTDYLAALKKEKGI